jgi:C4-dicarboxylate-specific signal transduction histidine kinase
LRLFGENLKRHDIRVEVDVPADLPAVHAQPQQLQQVLLNLVVNARDALQHGPSRAVRRIELRAGTGDSGTVWCSVRDSGPGIPADLLARVFDPFVTTKRAQGGSGLGLSVSRKIIESFGGTLAGRSVAGEFAEFSFVLHQAETNGWAAGTRRPH